MTLEEARAWMDSSAGEREFVRIDEAADDALDAAEAYIREMSAFPSSNVSEFRRGVSALERAQDEFDSAATLIGSGRARDGRAVTQACRRYVSALIALEEMNARHGAFVESRVAYFAAQFAADYIRRATALRRRFQEAVEELEQLRAVLPRARRDIDEAVVQAGIDALLNVVTALLPQFGIPARIAIATASVLGGLLLDDALGPTGPGAHSTANSTLGAFTDLLPTVSSGISRLTSTSTALLTAWADVNEITEAERIFADIRARILGLMRSLPELMRQLRADTGDMETAWALYEGAARRARSTSSAYRSSEGEYRVLLRELSSIR